MNELMLLLAFLYSNYAETVRHFTIAIDNYCFGSFVTLHGKTGKKVMARLQHANRARLGRPKTLYGHI